MRLHFLLPILFLSQEPQDVMTLEMGVAVQGVVDDDDAVVRAPILDANYTQAMTVGKTWRLTVGTSGPYHLELHSFDFDAYLVLRDVSGSLLGEDDDGLLGTHARLTSDLEADHEYRVTACALHGMRGSFELRLAAGDPPSRTAAERSTAEQTDGLARIEWLGKRHGKESLEVAGALRQQGLVHYQAGHYAEARPLFMRALAILEKAVGVEHPLVADGLNMLAVALEAAGLYAEAEPLYERALSILETALGSEHPNVAGGLNNLAGLYRSQGRYAEAAPLYERALATLEAAVGAEHPNVAQIVSNLGLVFYYQGRFDRAEPLYERALATRETLFGPEHPAVGESLNNLAQLYAAQGRYAEADPLFERGLAVYETTLGSGHPDVAAYLDNIAVLVSLQGRYAEAEPLYERALAIREKVLGAEHRDVANNLNNLATLMRHQGRFAEAEPLYERALEIYEKALGPEHHDFGLALANFAQFHVDQGRLLEAVPLCERALAVLEQALGDGHPTVATSLNNLAAIFEGQGRYAEAESLCERALAIRKKALGPEHPDVANSLGNLALLNKNQGRHSQARPLYERALAIREKALGPAHPDIATTLNNLATLDMAQGRYTAAEALYERALAIREQGLGPEHPDVGSSRNNLAVLYEEQGRHAEAGPLFVRALEGLLKFLDRELPTQSEADRFRLLAKSHGPSRILANALRQKAKPGRSLFDLCLQWKGKVTRLQVASLRLGRTKGDPAVRAQIGTLQGLQKELSGLVFLPEDEKAENHGDRVQTLREQRVQAERELNRALGLDDLLATPTSSQLQSKLPADAILVDFHVGRFVFAWVLRADGQPELIPLGEAAPLHAAQERFLRSAIALGEPRVGDTDLGAELHDLLWQPLSASVGSATTVFVSSDGFLSKLPLGVLPGAEGGYLLEKHRFVYVPDSTRLAAAGPKSDSRQGAILAVGDVDYSHRGEAAERRPVAVVTRARIGESWQPLRGTRDELQSLRSLHDDTLGWSSDFTQIDGSAATEEGVRLHIPGQRYLHFATHGYFEPEYLPSLMGDAEQKQTNARYGQQLQAVGLLPGLLSGLVFAGVNADPDPSRDDGYLSAEEVQYLDLSSCDIAVLSACETALGSARSGEGLMSLRRAFEVAGTKTVVSSLWRVDDRATVLLMRGFYENYWLHGMGKAEALHHAKLEMIQGRRPPREWGAFVLSGDWR
ncbi:MAG: tetratricopeptide (TPR) repeat protein [Candidatus Paceibacteria bacterium]|jgi:tetratricopeptide (TPR) repeat protein